MSNVTINNKENDEVAIISSKFKHQIFEIKKLIDALERDFDDFHLEEYFTEFKGILDKFKVVFVQIRDAIIQAIEKKRVDKFEELETQLETFFDDFREEEEIAGVMIYLYELYVCNGKDIDTRDIITESESNSNDETWVSEENPDKPIKPVITKEESKKAVDIVGIQSPDDLRSKYFPKGSLKEYLSELSLNLSNKDDVDFMKEFIKKKQAIDVEKYTFKLPENYDDEWITRDFIDTWVNPKACKEIELIDTSYYDSLWFSPYESWITKIIEAGNFRLNLKNFELDESTLKEFATKVESKNIMIDLSDCYLKYWKCKKHEKITWYYEKQWKLNSVRYGE